MNKVKSLSRVRLFATPWTVAYQAPPSMGVSRKYEYSGLIFFRIDFFDLFAVQGTLKSFHGITNVIPASNNKLRLPQ